MADQFTLTSQPVRLSSPGKQALDQSLEVSDYDELDVLLGLIAVEGTTTGVVVKIITAMQKDSESGWVDLVTFASLDGPDKFDLQNAPAKLLKYIRWEVTDLGGATSVTVTIDGMLRRIR